METVVPSTQLTCTQCGGELHPDEGQLFVTCPYCSATVYLDKSRVVFHWYLAPTLDENKARGALARWMAGNQTVKNLDQKARLVGSSFQFFPVWYLKHLQQGKEMIGLEPAAATSVTELRRLRLPAGDLKKYEPDLDSQSLAPSVPLDTALGWLKQSAGAAAEVKETALVHIPLYTFKYIYQNRTYTALVEAGTGAVLANIFPAKAEAPYIVAGIVTALVYLCLALMPILFSGDNNSSGLGWTICLGGGVIAAPFLFALALWVAARV
jgi:predicted RNA-binding Zn-ribbon protein involved in translation (DUF1610 family)